VTIDERRNGHRISYGSTIYEISSVRVPDERPLSDALCYTIVEAAEVFG